MKCHWLLLVSLAGFALSAEAAPPDAAINRAVARLSVRLSGGIANPDPATVEYIVSTKQVAAFFILHDPGGGNGTSEIIAFFSPSRDDGHRRPASYRLLAYTQIGSDGSREFQADSGIVHNGRIELEGAAHLPKDPLCCPSQAIRSSFTVKNGHVVERALAPDYSFKRTAAGGLH
jgi:hypothetical protein